MKVIQDLSGSKKLIHRLRRFHRFSGFSNYWLKKQGLISIKELWVDIYPPIFVSYDMLC